MGGHVVYIEKEEEGIGTVLEKSNSIRSIFGAIVRSWLAMSSEVSQERLHIKPYYRSVRIL